MAESCMELPDLSCTNPDIRAYTNRARQNFEENCKSSFYNLPLHKFHPFQPTIKDTPSTSANTTKSLENEKQQNLKVMTHFLRNNWQFSHSKNNNKSLKRLPKKQKFLKTKLTWSEKFWLQEINPHYEIRSHQPNQIGRETHLTERTIRANIKPRTSYREWLIVRHNSPKYHPETYQQQSPSRSPTSS